MTQRIDDRVRLTLAKARGVLLHTHLAETEDENGFCEEVFGCRPLDYVEDVRLVGDQELVRARDPLQRATKSSDLAKGRGRGGVVQPFEHAL